MQRVVEHKDADADELAVREVATSVYAFDHAALRSAVNRPSAAKEREEHGLAHREDREGDHAADQPRSGPPLER